MPEYIEVENGIARVINKSIVRQIPLSELLKRVEKVPEITLPTIARSQVFTHWQKSPHDGSTFMYILCELQPGVRSITKNNRRTNPRGLRRYRLAFPWTYFFFQANTSDGSERVQRWSIHSSRVFFARDQYKDVNSSMIVAPLPNLDSTGEVCWGSTGVPANQSLADQLDQKVNEWYLSNFNDDLDSHVRLPYGERNYLRWVTESREDANSWRNWPEFSDPNLQQNVTTLLATRGIELTEAERFIGGGFITPVTLPMTYGRWDEWWQAIPPAERIRAIRSAENVRADAPEDFPEDGDDVETAGVVDDGGVPA